MDHRDYRDSSFVEGDDKSPFVKNTDFGDEGDDKSPFVKDTGLATLFIQQFKNLEEMKTKLNSTIADLASTNPAGVIPVQDELEIVSGLIFETTETLKEIQTSILRENARLLRQIPPGAVSNTVISTATGVEPAFVTRRELIERNMNTLRSNSGGRRKTRKRRKSRR